MSTTTIKSTKQPKKQISKLGQWMLNHKGGVIVVKDRKAVNK